MKSIPKDSQLLLSLLIASFVSVYFLPNFVNQVIFLIILFATIQTKKDYVYLVWFFIVNDAPGRLFSVSTFEGVRIPLYNLAPGISLSFQDLFLLAYLFKFLSSGSKRNFIFQREFSVFFIFLTVIFLYSFFFDFRAGDIILTLRIVVLPWTLIFIVPFYIANQAVSERVIRFLFPVVIFSFLSQIFYYLVGVYPDAYLRGGAAIAADIDPYAELVRSYSSAYISLFVTILATYHYFSNDSGFRRSYLLLVIILSVLSIFLTALRGYIIAYGVFFTGALFLFSSGRTIGRFVGISIISIIAFWILSFQFPLLRTQFQGSFERLITVQSIAEGDITAGGTLSRLDQRAPRVMSKFRENPVLGWGFSSAFIEYADGHVGHHNILLNVGIIGFLYLNFLFFYLCFKIWKYKKVANISGRSYLLFIVGLFAVFLIHSSSTQFWGYAMMFSQLQKVLFFSLYFAMINVILNESSHNKMKNLT
jgi:hypothetical protein